MRSMWVVHKFNVCTLEQFYNKIYTANKYTNK